MILHFSILFCVFIHNSLFSLYQTFGIILMMKMQGGGASGLLRKWRKWSMGYRELSLPAPTSFKRNKRSPVTVVVGKEKKMFKVESQILEYYQFQPLLEKASVGNGHRGCCIFLTCDAILFEHMLWLVDTHDPSLRSLNVELLLEFYAQESDYPNTASSLPGFEPFLLRESEMGPLNPHCPGIEPFLLRETEMGPLDPP